MSKKIGILVQGQLGGTDRILYDFESWLNEKNYTVEVLNKKHTKDLTDMDCLVLPTSELSWLWINRGKVNKNCRIMIWCMGHDALQAYFYNSSKKNFIYKVTFAFFYAFFLKKIISMNVLAYTDLVAMNLDLNHVNSTLKSESANIYPIPIDIKKINFEKRNNIKRMETFFWLGRVDSDFKIWSLLELLDALEIWVDKNASKISFCIIGDGDAVDLIDPNKYSYEVRMLGKLEYEVMEETIKSEASLLFAMGTSGIEGAKLMVPTIIVNPLRGNEKGVTYRWLYDSKGFSLGEFKNCYVFPEQKKENFEKLLKEYFLDYRKQALASYEYVKNYDRNEVYNRIMCDFNGRATFSILVKCFFIPFLSFKLKKVIRFLTGGSF